MPIFSPDTCLPHDPAGFGAWRIRHQLEHVQLRATEIALVPSIIVPEYDLGFWDDDPRVVALWLNRHQSVHEILRFPGAIPGVDLSAVDLTDDGEWADWQQDHADEHEQLRAFYGIP